MTEQLPEQKQRGIYEWFYPELKGKNWYIDDDCELLAYWWEGGPDPDIPLEELDLGMTYEHRVSGPFLRALYINGQPNYQWFCTDADARLLKEGYEVNKYGKNWGIGFDNRWYWNSEDDPIAALAEYVEGK